MSQLNLGNVLEIEKKLTDLLKQAEAEIRVENLAMSVGELLNMYREGELIIRPEYQRLLKWNDIQKTQLIESLLIGLPIPNIFVARTEGGKWELVDGLQRVSTIIDFIDGLKKEDYENIDKYERFETLNKGGLSYLISQDDNDEDTEENSDDFAAKSFKDFPLDMRLDLKRRRINMTILVNGTNEHVKYELFQRLNNGGSPIQPQEMRNAILTYKSPNYKKILDELSEHKFFEKFYFFAETKINDEYFNQRLVLLIIILYHSIKMEKKLKIQNIDLFMTEFVRDEITKEKYDPEKDKNMIQEVLDVVHNNSSLQKNIFKGQTAKKFSETKFLAIMLGILLNQPLQLNAQEICEKVNTIEQQDNFKEFFKRGISAASRIPRVIEFARTYFSK